MRASEYFERRAAEDPEFRALQQRPEPHMELGLNVNRLRNERGMTYEEFASATGLRLRRLYEIERGDANPRLKTLTRLAVALGVEPWQLIVPFQGEDEPIPEQVSGTAEAGSA